MRTAADGDALETTASASASLISDVAAYGSDAVGAAAAVAVDAVAAIGSAPWGYYALGATLGLIVLLAVEAALLYHLVLKARFAKAYPRLIRPVQVVVRPHRRPRPSP